MIEDPKTPPARRLRVGFATSDGVAVDAHFASTPRLDVWVVGADFAHSAQVASHTFSCRSGADGRHGEGGGARVAERIAAAASCALLFVADIGGPAAGRVVAAGIHPLKAAPGDTVESCVRRVAHMLDTAPPPWLRRAFLAAGAP